MAQLPGDSTLASVERVVLAAARHTAYRFNRKRPEVIVLAHEEDPRHAARPASSAAPRCAAGRLSKAWFALHVAQCGPQTIAGRDRGLEPEAATASGIPLRPGRPPVVGPCGSRGAHFNSMVPVH